MQDKLNKTKLAQKLKFVCPCGKYNGRKLKNFCCKALNIDEEEYKWYRTFTPTEIEKLLKAANSR